MGAGAAGGFGGMGSFAPPVIEPPIPEIIPPPPIQPPPIEIAMPEIAQDAQLAQMLQRAQEHQAILPPPPSQGIPVNQGKGTPDNPLKFLDGDSRVTQQFNGERGAFQRPPGDVILHDRAGSTPADGPRYGVPRTGDTFPYHVEVQPDGSIRQFHQGSSQGVGQVGMNPSSIGIAYGGPYGGTPTPEGMRSLQDIYSRLKDANPDLQFRSHGQAYADTVGGPYQASVAGRDLREASWRDNLNDVPRMAPPNGPFEQFAFQPQQKMPFDGRPGSQSVTGVSANSVNSSPIMTARAAPPPIGDRGIMGPAVAGLRAPQAPAPQIAKLPPPTAAAQMSPNDFASARGNPAQGLSPNDNATALLGRSAPGMSPNDFASIASRSAQSMSPNDYAAAMPQPPVPSAAPSMGMADARDPMRSQLAPSSPPQSVAESTPPPSRVTNFAPPLPLEYQAPGASRFAQQNLPSAAPSPVMADAGRSAAGMSPNDYGAAPNPVIADASRFAQPNMANATPAPQNPMIADVGRYAQPGMRDSASALNPEKAPTLAAALQQQNGMGVVNPGASAQAQAAPAPSIGSPAQTMPSQPSKGWNRLADANDPMRKEKAPGGVFDFMKDPNKNLAALGKTMQALGGKYAAANASLGQMADIAPQTPARTPQPSQGSGRMRRFKSAFPVEPIQS